MGQQDDIQSVLFHDKSRASGAVQSQKTIAVPAIKQHGLRAAGGADGAVQQYAPL